MWPFGNGDGWLGSHNGKNGNNSNHGPAEHGDGIPMYGEADSPTSGSSSAPTDGVRAITKNTDVWFAYQISALEKEALAFATQWAEKGLPRHDLQSEEEQPVETSLRKRCTETYIEWVDRVRTRVQDTIDDISRHIGASLTDFKHGLVQLGANSHELTRTKEEREQLERESRQSVAKFGYRRLLSSLAFWLTVPTLVLVDFVANVPVFKELLPPDPRADQIFAYRVEGSEKFGLWSGLYRVWARTALYPDAAILALGVIVFLMFLGHTLGASGRPLLALSERDIPTASIGIRNHRKQHWVPLVLSFFGVLAVVTVLFQARERIYTAAHDRFRQDSAQVATLSADKERARASAQLERMSEISARLSDVEQQEKGTEASFSYASSIRLANFPILLLNCVLVISAAVVGYLHKSEDLVDGSGDEPRRHALVERERQLRGELREVRAGLRDSESAIQRDLGRVSALLKSHPLQDWEARVDRLNRVIPLFRAENARLRSLDPTTIRPFSRPARLELPAAYPADGFRAPEEVVKQQAEFQALKDRLSQLDAEVFPAIRSSGVDGTRDLGAE